MSPLPHHADVRSQPAGPIWSIILAGGKGTRLAEVYPHLPKPMVPALGKPFIEWVIRYLAGQGVQNHVVSLGHLAHIAEAYFVQREASGDHGGEGDDDLRIVTVRERTPLGTGGGVRFAWDGVPVAERTDASVLICNGDSLVLCDLAPAWAMLSWPEVDGVIVGVHVPDAGRFGTLEIDSNQRLVRFLEKRPETVGMPGVINAGVYIFKPSLRADFEVVQRAAEAKNPHPSGQAGTPAPFSMEQDLFPAILSAGRRIMVHAVRAPFLDIGTPESVREAEHFLATNAELTPTPTRTHHP